MTHRNSQKALYLQSQFYYSKKTQIRTGQRRDPLDQVWEGPKHKPSVSSSCTHSWYFHVYQLWVARNFIKISLYRQNQLCHWPHNLTQPPTPLPSPEVRLISSGSNPQPSNHKAGLSSMATPHPTLPRLKLFRGPP